MCVAQFREYCKASRFNHSNYDDDSKNPELDVKKGTEVVFGRVQYYVTDIVKMQELAKNNNQYAVNHLQLETRFYN